MLLSKKSLKVKVDISKIEKKHSGKFISNINFDAGQVNSLCSTGILNSMKDSMTLIALIGVMVYQNWKLTLFALIMMPYGTHLNSVMVKSSHYPGSNSPIKKLCCFFMYVCMHNSNQSHDQKLRK